MTDDIIIYKRLLKARRTFMIIIPKDMVDDGKLEEGAKYEVKFRKISEKENKELTPD